MRFRTLIPIAALGVAAVACDKTLQTAPYDRVPAESAITDLSTAQAALNGVYGALESTSYYGLDLEMLGDLPSDNGRWAGTYQFLNEIVNNRIAADNSEVTAMWTAMYRAVDRANVVITRVPALTGIPDATKNQIVGEAYFLRALTFHNLVKFWGPIPTPTTPVTTPADAANYTRTPVDQVYAQILSDLDKAAQLIPASNTNTRRATRTAVTAIRSRVLFYRASIANSAADYQAALDAANSVLAG
ncbi:MAG: RagB/SusD family nutrient uptake outer membrane protein, partial [Gemmatirosa sp.]|nr:RagB/SusD family nutrient uptake outer membrane protein [Gemmatirosa sp.]